MGYKILIITDDDVYLALRRMEQTVRLWGDHDWQPQGGPCVVAKLTGPNPVRHTYQIFQAVTGEWKEGLPGVEELRKATEVEEIETDA